MLRILLISFILASLISSVQLWSGNVCTRKTLKYSTSYYCSCTILWWCCGYSARQTPYYVTESSCCSGWDHTGDNNCSLPICEPACKNGGRCVSPNTCKCTLGYVGDICDGNAPCSHLDACYPGTCIENITTESQDTSSGNGNFSITGNYSDGNVNNSRVNNVTGQERCMCTNGFTGKSCLKFSDNFTAITRQIDYNLTKINTATKEVIAKYQVDATGTREINVLWTNLPEFNLIECSSQFTFDPDEIFGFMPDPPEYIANISYGIVDAQIELVHTKLDTDGKRYIANWKIFHCDGASNSSPVHSLKCNMEDTNILLLSSGDTYSLTNKVTSGGYRILKNTVTNTATGTDYYIGPSKQNELEFRIDRDKPIHVCPDNITECRDEAMKLSKDITQEEIHVTWRGWTDLISGIKRYVLEVWKLEYSIDFKGLREPPILKDDNSKPVFVAESMPNNHIFPKYKPHEPGVYSFILEINDKANNSEFVRRIAIYDNSSEISTNNQSQMYVSSASAITNYSWQTKYNESNVTEVRVNWTGLFCNSIHEKGRFLEKILDYEPRFTDPSNPYKFFFKGIDSKYDDNEGSRTKAKISSICGIIKFEIAANINSSQSSWDHEWRMVSPLREFDHFELPENTIKDGIPLNVSVKATDIMNHTKVVTSVVRFDKSPPKLSSPDLFLNVADGKYPFTSRIIVPSGDVHSGLNLLRIQVIQSSSGQVRLTQELSLDEHADNVCPDESSLDCYCIDSECFTQKYIIDLNNCMVNLPDDKNENDRYSLRVTAYNGAMLETSVMKELGSTSLFADIQKFFSPSNITLVKKTDTTITIQWENVPNCHERLRNVVLLQNPGNLSTNFQTHRDVTKYTITELEPHSLYNMYLFSDYGNETSYYQSIPVMFGPIETDSSKLNIQVPGKQTSFPDSAAYGIGFGFFILCIVMAVLVVLGRKGKLQKIRESVRESIRKSFTLLMNEEVTTVDSNVKNIANTDC